MAIMKNESGANHIFETGIQLPENEEEIKTRFTFFRLYLVFFVYNGYMILQHVLNVSSTFEIKIMKRFISKEDGTITYRLTS